MVIDGLALNKKACLSKAKGNKTAQSTDRKPHILKRRSRKSSALARNTKKAIANSIALFRVFVGSRIGW